MGSVLNKGKRKTNRRDDLQEAEQIVQACLRSPMGGVRCSAPAANARIRPAVKCRAATALVILIQAPGEGGA